jgi:hypothetical protein
VKYTKKLNIIYNDADLYFAFKKYVLAPFYVIGVNPNEYLQHYLYYLGIDPTPKTTFPNTEPVNLIDNDLEKTEMPCYWSKLFGKEIKYLLTDSFYNLHESFHNIHLVAEKQGQLDWNVWGKETGNKVNLVWQNHVVQVPSYEDFAEEGKQLLNFNLSDWYIKFLGGKKNIDYQIGHAAYVLCQAGLVSADWYNQRRSAILDKYVNKVEI